MSAMGTIWLAGCSCRDYAAVQREVGARCPGAQVFRSQDLGTLASVAASLARSQGSSRACILLDGDAAVEAVGALVAADARAEVIALVRGSDPGLVARLFHAGAAEVLAADGASVRGDGGGSELAEEGASATEPSVRGDSVGAVGEVPRETSGLACEPDGEGMEAHHGGAPRGSGVVRDLDLDEPGPDAVRGRDRGHVEGRSGGVSGTGAMPAVAEGAGPRAPLVTFIRGRGGSGATLLAASMALTAAAAGLRTAVLDLDLMFGNLASLLGAERPGDLSLLESPAAAGRLEEADIVRASARIAPRLTLWGPSAEPERAELLGGAVEALIGVLRYEADLIIADTSLHWGDAVAAAVAASDRLVLVGTPDAASAPSCSRAVELARRLGVPRTRVAAVVNRCPSREEGEDAAARLRVQLSLGPVCCIADGGRAVADLAAIGHADDALASPGFGEDAAAFCRGTLCELGLVGSEEAGSRRRERTWRRFGFPIIGKGGGAR